MKKSEKVQRIGYPLSEKKLGLGHDNSFANNNAW